jgi:hypothetical protein
LTGAECFANMSAALSMKNEGSQNCCLHWRDRSFYAADPETFAQGGVRRLPGVEETIKWGFPHFV